MVEPKKAASQLTATRKERGRQGWERSGRGRPKTMCCPQRHTSGDLLPPTRAICLQSPSPPCSQFTYQWINPRLRWEAPPSGRFLSLPYTSFWGIFQVHTVAATFLQMVVQGSDLQLRPQHLWSVAFEVQGLLRGPCLGKF